MPRHTDPDVFTFVPLTTTAEPSFFRALAKLAEEWDSSNEISELRAILANVANEKRRLDWRFAEDCMHALDKQEPADDRAERRARRSAATLKERIVRAIGGS